MLDRSRTLALDGAILLDVQRRADHSLLLAAARTTSLAGEHAALWLLISAGGVTVDGGRRRQWVQVGAVTVLAHAAAVVAKRVVRRPRPSLAGLRVHGRTVSGLSFPSAHATSATAFAVACSPLIGRRVLALSAVMACSRLLVGAHYPSDVLAGVGLGALVGRTAGTRT